MSKAKDDDTSLTVDWERAVARKVIGTDWGQIKVHKVRSRLTWTLFD
jgi:hypothetical protein